MEKARLLEVCIDNFDSASKAVAAGAHRLEVCSSLSEGGLTPTFGLVSIIRKELPETPIYVMIRCNNDPDFIFSDGDVRVMVEDIKAFKSIGVNGFVFGSLMVNGSIDEVICSKILSECHPLSVTFHRAFDICNNPHVALEKIVNLGFERILTSGREQKATSDKARSFIKDLILLAGSQIKIMPGSGIRADDSLVKLLQETQALEIHASCLIKKEINSHSNIQMGKNETQTKYLLDQSMVEGIVDILKKY